MLSYSRSDSGCADSSHAGCEPESHALCCYHQERSSARLKERAVMLGAARDAVKRTRSALMDALACGERCAADPIENVARQRRSLREAGMIEIVLGVVLHADLGHDAP